MGVQPSSTDSGDGSGDNRYVTVFESELTHQREAGVLIRSGPYCSYLCRGGNPRNPEFPRVKAISGEKKS